MKLKFTSIKKGNYDVWNKKEEFLGGIYFDSSWKKWVWEQEEEIIMSTGCLKQIIDYMEDLNDEISL